MLKFRFIMGREFLVCVVSQRTSEAVNSFLCLCAPAETTRADATLFKVSLIVAGPPERDQFMGQILILPDAG